ncbi:MAG: hypothetical protein IKQ43_12060 [Treponema sp.]|nr:hypothetical protein [Treponema sp.]
MRTDVFNKKAGKNLNFFLEFTWTLFCSFFPGNVVYYYLEDRAMGKHGKSILEAVIVTIIILGFYGVYFGIFISQMNSMLVKLLVGIIPAILGVMMIYVCIQRIREIKGGQEDDLGKY